MSASAPVVLIEASPEAAAKRAADRVVEIIAERAGGGDNCHLALCGGTTPGELYRNLASAEYGERVAWDKVQIFFGDERDVPQDDVENTYRMVTKVLPDLKRYRLLIIDESHNLRNRDGARYQAIRDYIEENEPRCLLLTATPYNKEYVDIGNQLRLFIDEFLKMPCNNIPLRKKLIKCCFTYSFSQ